MAEPQPLAAERALAGVLPAAAWCCYAPLGLKYVGWLSVTALAVVLLQQHRRWTAVLLQPGMRLLLVLVGWLWLSALWSVAPAHEIVSHAWAYALLPSSLLIASACPPALAARALQHFVWASGGVGLLIFLHAQLGLPLGWLGASTATAIGNQLIMTSILLALGAATACSLVLQPTTDQRHRRLWLMAAAACLLGLASQDRRSGMLLLPLLLLALALAGARAPKLKLGLVLLILAGTAAVWTASDTVRERFAEGETELLNYERDTAAVTSWGQRVRMIELTVQQVRERPLLGHGLGSWRTLLREHSVIGTWLWDNSTPHNDYLLVAAQAGVPAALAFAAWLLVRVQAARRCGRVGLPALMVWLAIVLCALPNAVLRDAKLALPMLLLAGLASAMMQTAPADNRGSWRRRSAAR